MIGFLRNRSVARLWHALTALAVFLSVATQLALVLANVNIGFGVSSAPMGQRVFQFFSYFTIQSNLLVGVVAVLLALNPSRDGRLFRAVRTGGLFGITVTLLVYQFLLSPIVNFTGLAAVSNVGLHYVVPAAAILAWVVCGPHPRSTWRALLLAMLWPLAFVVLTIGQGLVTGFYPYPFVNIAVLGFPRAALNGLGILALLLAIGAVYVLLDAWISRKLRASEHTSD